MAGAIRGHRLEEEVVEDPRAQSEVACESSPQGVRVAVRYLVQNYLYDTDQVGWLAAFRLILGYPLFIVASAVSVLIVASGSHNWPSAGTWRDRIRHLRQTRPGRPDSA